MIKNDYIREEIFGKFPPLSDEYKNIIEKEIMPQFMFYRTVSRTTKAYCTCCENIYTQSPSSQPYINMKHGTDGKCPVCGSDIRFYCSGYGTANVSNWAKRNVVVFNAQDGDLYIRVYTVYISFEDYGIRKLPQFIYQERYRYYYGKEGTQKWKYSYKSFQATKNMNEPFFVSCGYGRADNSYLTCGLEELEKTIFKYCCIDEAEREFNKREYNLCVFSYLNEYFRHPNIEYLLKGGFADVLVCYMKKGYAYNFKINFKSNDLKQMLGLNSAEIKMLKGCACGLISNYKKCKRYFPNVPISDLKKLCIELGIYVEEFCYIHDKTKLSFQCMVNYMRKKLLGRAGLYEWRDYIDQCIELNYSLDDTEINRPKNLVTAHERLTNIIKHKANKELRKKFKKRYESLLKEKCMEDDVFIIIPPKSQTEIINEGKKLSHCVGGYAERYALGKCDILFLRKKEDPGTPFFTIEVRGDNIIQYRGYKNNLSTPVPDEVTEFVNRYKDFLKRRK